MGLVQQTYYLVRLAEERLGPVVAVGDRLVYRAQSRIAWLDPIFDLPPGTVCEVVSIGYDPATGAPDYDEFDNHYHYTLRGMEEHGGLSTTEVVALFDLEGGAGTLRTLATAIVNSIVSRLN